MTKTVVVTNEKRIAWITGGGSGIGLAGAQALAADGWTVAISGRRRDALADAAKRIGNVASGMIDVFPLDVARAKDVQAVAGSILAKHGQIDLLVNSAGINVPKRSWKELEITGWDQIVEVNLSGVLYAIHAVLPAMRDRKSGSVINIASWAGRIVSQMTGPAYTATKHAILALTHSFNMDECRNGLRACWISPGESGNSHHEATPGASFGKSDVEDAPAGGPWANDRVCGEHATACLCQRDSDQSGREPSLPGRLFERRFRLLGIFMNGIGEGAPARGA